jgi:hypothetical protein
LQTEKGLKDKLDNELRVKKEAFEKAAKEKDASRKNADLKGCEKQFKADPEK